MAIGVLTASGCWEISVALGKCRGRSSGTQRGGFVQVHKGLVIPEPEFCSPHLPTREKVQLEETQVGNQDYGQRGEPEMGGNFWKKRKDPGRQELM